MPEEQCLTGSAAGLQTVLDIGTLRLYASLTSAWVTEFHPDLAYLLAYFDFNEVPATPWRTLHPPPPLPLPAAVPSFLCVCFLLLFPAPSRHPRG